MGEERRKNTVVLIAFYNRKALGVRYLETALRNSGYWVKTIFYKDFNSIHPSKTTEQELALLLGEIRACAPFLIGLSVMSSMYLDTVHAVMETIRGAFGTPIVCGGAFATMFPEHFLQRGADFVIRSDGEQAICRLAHALCHGEDRAGIPSLCYQEGENIVYNEIGGISVNLDEYGLPAVTSADACLIEQNTLTRGDPQKNTRSYEVVASRGCPFTCSYCCCVNLRRLLPQGTKAVRIRSVASIIEELKLAKCSCRKLAFIHFYDEIFPNQPGWLDEFVTQYKTHIHMPFTIWSHPKMMDLDMLRKLKIAGLMEVIMGIQSGSTRIRRDVFHRYETQEEILKAVHTIRQAGIFWSSFDFMLQHPFETLADLQDTYWLVKQLPSPYELQLHGLNFLPGTDIVPMAIEQGYFTQSEMDAILYAPMEVQFGTYWQRETSPESRLWYEMIYCRQFALFRPRLDRMEKDPLSHEKEIHRLYQIGRRMAKARYLYKKGYIVYRRLASTQ